MCEHSFLLPWDCWMCRVGKPLIKEALKNSDDEKV